MIRSEQKLANLHALLNKDNNILITQAIKLLREELPFEGAIGLLAACYDKTDDSSVRRSIEGFMNDLKDQSACVEVINEIKKQWKADTISMLVSSCWQSGLNYSEFSRDLTDVFLKGDYITAVECLTVIEESVEELTRKTRDDIIKTIEDAPISPVPEKIPLALELISILKR
jgi:predicted DNA-binding protein